MVRTELAAVARVGLPLRQRFVVHALLATEQQIFTAFKELAVVDGQVSSNAVLLYKALGGGWQVVPESTSGADVLREQETFTTKETSS